MGHLRRRRASPTARSRAKPSSLTGEVRHLGRTSSSGSPDGKTLVFTADQNGRTRVHLRRCTSTDAATAKLTFDGGHESLSALASSRDGNRHRSASALGMTVPPRGRASHGDSASRSRRAVDVSQRQRRSCSPNSTFRGPSRSTVPVEGGVKMQMWILKPPGFDAKKKWPVVVPRPRRAAGGVGRRLELPLEPGAVGRAGLRRRPAQPAGLDRLRPEVRRRDHRRLGRQVLPRPGAGLDYVEKLPYVDKDRIGRGRGVVRRLHDELVRGQRHRAAVQVPDHATAASGTSRACRARPTNCGSTSGSTAACRGRSRASYAEFSPHKKAGEPRQVQDADAASSRTTSTSAARSARGTSCSPPCSGRACRRASSTSRTRGTGC